MGVGKKAALAIEQYLRNGKKKRTDRPKGLFLQLLPPQQILLTRGP